VLIRVCAEMPGEAFYISANLLHSFRELSMFIDLTTVVSTLVAHAPLTAVAVLVLILYIERRLRPIEIGIVSLESRIASLESRVASLESRVSSLDGRVNSLEARLTRVEAILAEHSKNLDTLIDFGETLLSIQTFYRNSDKIRRVRSE